MGDDQEVLKKVIAIMEKTIAALRELETPKEDLTKPWKLTVVGSRELCNTNKRFCTKMLMFVYRFQTNEEQMAEVTVEQNGVGFNKLDAGYCTSVAEQVIKYGHMTDRQWNVVRDRMQKYCDQALRYGFTYCSAEDEEGDNFSYPEGLSCVCAADA